MRPLLLTLCSHNMKSFLHVGVALGIFSVAGFALAVLLAYRASPPGEVLKKYSIGTRMSIFLPLSNGWKEGVDSEHIHAIQEHRRIAFTLTLVFYCFAAVNIAYYAILGQRLFIMLSRGQCGG